MIADAARIRFCRFVLIFSLCQLCLGADTSSCTRLNYLFEENRCGDGIVEALESCDDGNTVNGDGCSTRCEIEPVGDVPPEEEHIIESCSPSEVQCPDGVVVEAESETCTLDCREHCAEDLDDSGCPIGQVAVDTEGFGCRSCVAVPDGCDAEIYVCPNGVQVLPSGDDCQYDCRDHCYFEVDDECGDGTTAVENIGRCGTCFGGSSDGCPGDVLRCVDGSVSYRRGASCDFLCPASCEVDDPMACEEGELVVEADYSINRCYECQEERGACRLGDLMRCPDGTVVPATNFLCDRDCRDHCGEVLAPSSCPADKPNIADLNGDGCPECTSEDVCQITGGYYGELNCDQFYRCGYVSSHSRLRGCEGVYTTCGCHDHKKEYVEGLGCTSHGVECAAHSPSWPNL